MVKTKTTGIVRGCARKSIVPVAKEGGELMVCNPVAPKACSKNPVAAAAAVYAFKAKKQEEKEKFVRKAFAAAREKKWGTVLSMVNVNNVNEPDELGRRLLMIAAMQDEIVVMEHLVRGGAFKQATDVVGRDALFYAVREGVEQAPKWLIENGVQWEHALETAVKEGELLLAERFKIFGATDEQIAGLMEKYPNPSRVLSDRARITGDTANAVHELGLNHRLYPKAGDTAKVGPTSPSEVTSGDGKRKGPGSLLGC